MNLNKAISWKILIPLGIVWMYVSGYIYNSTSNVFIGCLGFIGVVILVYGIGDLIRSITKKFKK